MWDGSCIVHEAFSLEKLIELYKKNPDAVIIAHPESETPILKTAQYIGSTSGMINYVKTAPENKFIVATESGIIHQMEKANPTKTFIPAPPNNSCACNDCPYMKRNTLEKLYLCIKNGLPEVTVPEHIIELARKPIQRRLDISAELGL